MFLEIIIWLLVAVLPPFILLHLTIVPKKSVKVSESSHPLHSGIYRAIHSKDALLSTPLNGSTTMYEVMAAAAAKFKDRKLFGYRELIRIVTEEKMVSKIVDGVEEKVAKKWNYFELSEYQWMTYSQVYDSISMIGAGLHALGLSSKEKLTLFAPTNQYWMMVAHGAFTQNITITTAYDTLGVDGLSFSLNEGNVCSLFTSIELLNLVPDISVLSKTLKTVIYAGKNAEIDVKKISDTCPNLKIISLTELMDLGSENPTEHSPPKPDDVACIMYTSGSTGNPKGVIMSHKNLVAGLTCGEDKIINEMSADDVYLSFLPLAHILEFMIENIMIHLGVRMGYGSVKTLTDLNVRNCLGDIRELKPTCMAGVPQVWEGIRKGVLGKVEALPPLMQGVFKLMFSIKSAFMKVGLPTMLLDAVIFNKIKAQTGGRLRFALSGGAPIPHETHNFLTVCVCPVIQGYGLTETVGIVAIQDLDQGMVMGSVGAPCASVELKLVSELDSKYSVNNVIPQGEIWVRGPSITQGYYNQPTVTKETFSDEWLCTGDIGEIRNDGTIAIIDRKKNLIKLSNGEYVALEKLEAIYKSSKLVQNICAYADPHKTFCVAIVVPLEKELIKLGVEKGVLSDGVHDLADLAKNKNLKKLMLSNLTSVGKAAGLKGGEILGAIALANEEWTIENKLLTAAQKLKRRDIIDEYKVEIDIMYS